VSSVLSCAIHAQERHTPNYYENLFTGEILSKTEFEDFKNNLRLQYADSLKGQKYYYKNLFSDGRISGDSIIQYFKYSIKIGTKYIIRRLDAKKIDMNTVPQTLLTINDESVTIGGVQDKPTLINLWFVECPGCIEEMPVLNKLKEKYADKINFIAITYDKKQKVEKFLEKHSFNYTHIINAQDYIDYIKSSPYPESIFIDKKGVIKFIESVVSNTDEGFIELEDMIKELLVQE
jgi:thiol-disulfide isomerase/thioredoxin